MRALMYHYVRPDNAALPHFRHLHIEDFRRQLDHLAQDHRFCSRAELIEAVESGEPLRDGVVLTFDDGLKDHYEFVFPELVRRQIMGIFYVSTQPLEDGRLLDVHRIHLLLGLKGGRAVWESLVPRVSEEMLSHEHVREFREQTYRTQVNDELTNRVKRTLNYYIDYQHRRAVLDALMREHVPQEEAWARQWYASASELAEMNAGGMWIGSHTVTHPCLSKISTAEQKLEIDDSFHCLEDIIGPGMLRTFCYPYGGFHTFTGETERLLDKAGCIFSFNVEHRNIQASDLRQRRQALPRYDCNRFPYGSVRGGG